METDKKIIEYGLATSMDPEEFVKFCNQLVGAGYTPLGGMATAQKGIGTPVLLQPFVKYEEVPACTS